jgi:regulator of sirC expression with transglutaminase-like and TPR domain
LKKYDEIINLDKFNIDAINSKAYCVKFMAAAKGAQLNEEKFEEISRLYLRVLNLDSYDVEANFNLGLLYLQYG